MTKVIFEQDSWDSFYRASPIKRTRDIFDRIMFSCNETLVFCQFWNNPFECCAHTVAVHNQNGRCFTVTPPGDAGFDSPRPVQEFTGSQAGLMMLVKENRGAEISFAAQNFLDAGIKAYINFDPKSPLPGNEVAVGSGQHAWVKFQNILSRAREPGADCSGNITRNNDIRLTSYSTCSGLLK